MATTWSPDPISIEILPDKNTYDLMPMTLILYFMFQEKDFKVIFLNIN